MATEGYGHTNTHTHTHFFVLRTRGAAVCDEVATTTLSLVAPPGQPPHTASPAMRRHTHRPPSGTLRTAALGRGRTSRTRRGGRWSGRATREQAGNGGGSPALFVHCAVQVSPRRAAAQGGLVRPTRRCFGGPRGPLRLERKWRRKEPQVRRSLGARVRREKSGARRASARLCERAAPRRLIRPAARGRRNRSSRALCHGGWPPTDLRRSGAARALMQGASDTCRRPTDTDASDQDAPQHSTRALPHGVMDASRIDRSPTGAHHCGPRRRPAAGRTPALTQCAPAASASSDANIS